MLNIFASNVMDNDETENVKCIETHGQKYQWAKWKEAIEIILWKESLWRKVSFAISIELN